MKSQKIETKVESPTLSINPQPRDITWHSGSQLPVKGDYLVEVVVEERKVHMIYTHYIYWDGENPYVYNNNNYGEVFMMDDILSWAFDGDDI